MEKAKVIVTGASGSIGGAASRILLKNGCDVVMACRNIKKGNATRDVLLHDFPCSKVELLHLDLASSVSVKHFCQEVAQMDPRPKYLLNNAGIMCRDFSTTADGFEMTVGTNLIGTALLIRLIMPLMGNGFHIVNTVSLTRYVSDIDSRFFDVDGKRFRQLGTYGESKLALLLYSLRLSQTIPEGCYVNMTDPGVVNSNMITMKRWFDPLADILFRPFFCSSPEKGAIPACNALFSNDNGLLFSGKKKSSLPKKFANHKMTEWIWNETNSIIDKLI
ncbi:MAG: SDR family NAD(P)-dependent oxidoreductase [Candidatus Limimorpha sp.]